MGVLSMKNTLTDLNNHLFAQIERLGDEDIIGEQLDEEIKRSKAIAVISSQIISNADMALRAKRVLLNADAEDIKLPVMLEDKIG